MTSRKTKLSVAMKVANNQTVVEAITAFFIVLKCLDFVTKTTARKRSRLIITRKNTLPYKLRSVKKLITLQPIFPKIHL